MEWTLIYTIWSGICLGVALLLIKNMVLVSSRQQRLPPGPPGWPVVGNLFDLSRAPHLSLSILSQKYGPVLWLRLGAVNTMVVSSAEAATEFFRYHDLAFADRKTYEFMSIGGFAKGSLSLAQYGPYWRMLRRICSTELLSSNRINDTETLRSNCINKMMKWMWEEAKKTGSIEVSRFVSLGSFNVIGNAALSKDTIVDPHSQEGSKYFDSLSRLIELSAEPNVADLFPFLRWLDPQCFKRKGRRLLVHPLKFASGFVKERFLDRQKGHINAKKDFLDVMLDFEGNQKDGEPAKMSEKNIIIMILELFIASTDTTSTTTEWAITELLRNPHAMRNVEAELDQVVGHNEKVNESHIEKLPYLQAVVKETLRLHPPVPLLVPRNAREDTEFMGYTIPKDTQVLVNVWAIGRDPACWDDPLSFKPERFISSDIDFRGQHFQFIPFGAGRRMCAGILMAHRMVHLALGSLIHSFEWALADGITPETMDMSETIGIALRKAHPLKAVIKLREEEKNQDI
ncbi:Cytochrome p450 [Thalictrum thalictroides]|uniref:Cytochrome p450 n=1 Tax=Thalictrum thalictroides TaxID=46969 RepID=A0A7J6UXI0_THATH|nr:Cytochrome p450 [Thalictrum thalictroides]